jgi:short-chain fatty acids transporter
VDRLGAFFHRLAAELVPDPFVFAILLAGLTFVFAYAFGTAGPPAGDILHRLGFLSSVWGEGFFATKGLEFAMQMALVLTTGHALAVSPPVYRIVRKLAAVPKSAPAASAFVAFFTCVAALVNWGLGLVVGALLCREVGREASRQGRAVHYPLLGAAGFLGLLVWHGGLSGSAPLTVATPTHALVAKMGVIPTSLTLFSPLNLGVSLALLAVAPAVCWALTPRDPARLVPPPEEIRTAPDVGAPEALPAPGVRPTLAERADASPLLTVAAVAFGVAALWLHFLSNGFALNLNVVNLTFLTAGLAAHGTLGRYTRAVGEAVRGTGGIVLQFPFYFGITALMERSGLTVRLAEALVHGATASTYPLYTFFSASVVNTFVPSGGAQWAVQGPVIVETARRLGPEAVARLPTAVLALAYGDQWTNMIQPFWSIPLLGLTALRARDIMGYTALVMFAVTPVFVLALLLFG